VPHEHHSTRELDLTHWGVEMARKGGVPKNRVLNCISKDELASYLEQRRRPESRSPCLMAEALIRASGSDFEKRAVPGGSQKAFAR
jgi:hypothetical protein